MPGWRYRLAARWAFCGVGESVPRAALRLPWAIEFGPVRGGGKEKYSVQSTEYGAKSAG